MHQALQHVPDRAGLGGHDQGVAGDVFGIRLIGARDLQPMRLDVVIAHTPLTEMPSLRNCGTVGPLDADRVGLNGIRRGWP
jgi:hypothetical protein